MRTLCSKIPCPRISRLYTTLIIVFVGIPFFMIFLHKRVRFGFSQPSDTIHKVSDNFQPNYSITLPGNTGKIVFRNRPLSVNEYYQIGKQSKEGKKLHDETYAGILSHGTRVQLLDKIGPSMKIRIQLSNGKQKAGFIAITVEGRPSLTRL